MGTGSFLVEWDGGIKKGSKYDPVDREEEF